MAEFAAKPNQVKVKPRHEHGIAGEERVHPLVRVILRPHESQAPRDTSDVRIDRKIGLSKGEEENDPRRLFPHPWGGEEPSHRLVERTLSEEGKIERSTFLRDPLEDLFDADRLLAVQPSDPDRLGDLFYRGLLHLIEAPESRNEGSVSPDLICVVGVLREDRPDQGRKRIAPWTRDLSVAILEAFRDPSCLLLGLHTGEDRGGSLDDATSRLASCLTSRRAAMYSCLEKNAW